uniref:Uncharacterized protein n=1 Tax=Chromera velia CCMP2878 TaxID=1169474 RepID=A0A0G4I9H6_9ALVE|mmetsp:Transcript_55401/g.108454  ORF Transcript_55401/g.108454 Transcript_55401/m.108454 type:complete len:231 (-) Transcript_55401:162-854(-)|eukprot:Cvel_12148.t1-p1 / transcript=Cvel_12148.t1 / gene=Cvel_12148 / organism=Chromera_velia_CCMP2878 / gene_product=Vacuolar protein sorting-associated protein 32, putative / transcript_product=Vacuolar protein sorting-associated protein 32, putative / location=Cvel_scaffold783:22807-23991(+) / protein_length=230 / sequence_SO=supercontig / SO=protein_coding / is_pseudo=false
MRLFFGKKKEETPQVDIPTAIKQNKEALEVLEKRHALLEKKIQKEQEDAIAKTRAKNKSGALMALKRKQMFTAQMEQVNNQRLTLEQQVMTLESSQSQAAAVGALKVGVQAQKVMGQTLNIDKIDELMDDIQEQKDLQNEIDEVFKQQANVVGDDEDLLAELAELEGQQLDDRLLEASGVPSSVPTGAEGIETPAVPSGPISSTAAPSRPAASKVKSDEEQLAELQASLA